MLHFAVDKGRGPLIVWLLKTYGSDIKLDLKNNDGYTFESLAKRLGIYDISKSVKEGMRFVKN